MKLNDVEGAYHCPLCNKPSVQDVVGCDNCMEWYHFKCLCLPRNQSQKRGFVAIVTLKTIQECCRVCNKSYFFLCLNLRQYGTNCLDPDHSA